jgi:hypothetical protein
VFLLCMYIYIHISLDCLSIYIMIALFLQVDNEKEWQSAIILSSSFSSLFILPLRLRRRHLSFLAYIHIHTHILKCNRMKKSLLYGFKFIKCATKDMRWSISFHYLSYLLYIFFLSHHILSHCVCLNVLSENGDVWYRDTFNKFNKNFLSSTWRNNIYIWQRWWFITNR